MRVNPVTIHLVTAARPNFMKVAPLFHALARESWCRPVIVHTGQHYDPEMSEYFLQDLNLPQPDIELGVGSGTHSEQTARVMVAYEKICLDHQPDWVIVVGDVNSTMACTLAAKKLRLRVAHLEAGLRSGDMTMPEEINRVVTDALADLLWTPSPDADKNLRCEGIAESRVVRVGNIMLDSFEMLRGKIEAQKVPGELGLEGQRYGVVTLHRPSNVDNRETLTELVEALLEAAGVLPLIFPIHPRTRKRLEEFGLASLASDSRLRLIEPLGYVQFMSLVRSASVVVTDSGGIQEETTYLGIPCLTVRDTTERPITVNQGSNRLIRAEKLVSHLSEAVSGTWQRGRIPELWDGKTAGRVVKSLKQAVGI